MTHSNKSISPLRQRMIDDMTLRMLKPKTQATYLLESKVDIRVIQVLLGHRKLETTARYSHVATRTISEVTSPLEQLALPPAWARAVL